MGEKETTLPSNGFFHLAFGLLLVVQIAGIVLMGMKHLIVPSAILVVVGFVWLSGLLTIQPNQAAVLVFFGTYKGTIKQHGFFWLNPFYSTKKVSLRIRNLETEVIKVNDEQGNPILISAVVVWKITDTYKASFDIESADNVDPKSGAKLSNEEAYQRFIKIQAEGALRKIAHSYPYDNIDDVFEGICLRSGGDEINTALASEIRERLHLVGIEVLDARISNLSYAPEIAAIMLQRQQAQAIIAARKKIVEGSVSMVEMALEKLAEKNLIRLDDEKNARMVGNLLLVLCSDTGATPVIALDKD